MTDKAELIQARNEMMALLDEKLKNVPEWRAFRIMDKAISAMDRPPSVHVGLNGDAVARWRARSSYGDLAVEFIEHERRPSSTTEVVAYVATKRNRNPDDIRINIQSALSRDERLESIAFSGTRAWWFKGREVPK